LEGKICMADTGRKGDKIPGNTQYTGHYNNPETTTGTEEKTL
jgi:hypothetical protein